MFATTDNPRTGDKGDDNGHDFRVINKRRAETQIEYVEDGKQAWFADNRFTRNDDGTLTLN